MYYLSVKRYLQFNFLEKTIFTLNKKYRFLFLKTRYWRLSTIYTIGIYFVFQFLACTDSSPRVITPAFYHWKTNLSIDSSVISNLDSLKVEKLYIKFFDIDWSSSAGEAIPKAILIANDFDLQKEIIPTIFITNRTFLKTDEKAQKVLAQRTAQKIKSISKKYGIPAPKEIQFDCDWSGKTREAFFNFIKIFKKEIDVSIKISSTIRLHQVKYFEKTGVPPVDKGMLMFYNMSDLDHWETENSIIDLAEAEKYFQNFDKYPLTLDVALPAYSWAVLFRNGKLIKLIPGVKKSELEQFELLEPNRYKVNESTYFQGHYLYENDWLRFENIEHTTLLKAANRLAKIIENPNLTVSFYHLGNHSFEDFSIKMYDDVLEAFE